MRTRTPVFTTFRRRLFSPTRGCRVARVRSQRHGEREIEDEGASTSLSAPRTATDRAFRALEIGTRSGEPREMGGNLSGPRQRLHVARRRNQCGSLFLSLADYTCRASPVTCDSVAEERLERLPRSSPSSRQCTVLPSICLRPPDPSFKNPPLPLQPLR